MLPVSRPPRLHTAGSSACYPLPHLVRSDVGHEHRGPGCRTAAAPAHGAFKSSGAEGGEERRTRTHLSQDPRRDRRHRTVWTKRSLRSTQAPIPACGGTPSGKPPPRLGPASVQRRRLLWYFLDRSLARGSL